MFRRIAAVTAPSALSGAVCKAPTPSMVAAVTAAAARWNIIGKHKQPPGFRQGVMRAPISPEFAEEAMSLAKSAHAAKNSWDAIALYDRVLMFRRETKGAVSKPVAEVLMPIGRIFAELQEWGAAENAFSEAAAIYMELDGDMSITYAEALGLVALCYSNLNMLPEAEKAFNDTLTVYKDHVYNHGKHSWLPDDTREPPAEPNLHPLSSVAHALDDSSVMYIRRGQEAHAQSSLEEALEIRRYLYGRHPKFRPMIAKTLNKLSEIHRLRGNGTQAELVINECIEMCTQDMGRNSPQVASAVSSKGSLLSMQRKFREAKKCFEEAATTYAMCIGKEHPLVGPELVKIGRMHEFLEELPEAKKMYERGREILIRARGNDHPEVLEVLMYEAGLLIKLMKPEPAIEMMKDVARIRKSKDKDDPQLAFVYHKLGDALAMQREAEAEAYFLLSIEQFRSNHERGLKVAGKDELNNQKVLMTDVMDDLGLYYMTYKHHDRAEHYLSQALEIRREELGEENHPAVAYSYSNFAVLYLDKEEYGQCETFCRSALKVYEDIGKLQVLPKADVLTTLGQCMAAQKNVEGALKAHEEALNIRRVNGERTEVSVAESLYHIGQTHAVAKAYPKALKHLQEANSVANKFPEATKALRQEISRAIAAMPPIDEWGNEIRELPS